MYMFLPLCKGERIENLLATQTTPWAEQEWLARLLDIRTRRVEPTFRLEGHWIRKVAGIMGNGPGAGIDLSLCDVNSQSFPGR